jgi:predicted lysophospholipase L1 biosynthesis ABC-type transport system permease subunit
VAIVNEALARRLWPDGSPLGRQLVVGEAACEVVGVTPNTHPSRGGEGPPPFVYLAFWQSGMDGVRLFVKVTGDPAAALPALRRVLTDVDSDVHVGQEMPLVERTRMSFESERLMGRILGAASVLGLLLSALGLYGTMAFAVGRRTREIGIRAALGARPGDVLGLVLGQGMRLALAGLALGAAAAFAATRTLSAYLYGVEARDPTTFGVVAALLLSVALAASYVPASRASRVDPSSALRQE